jgi:hypothetical protein
MLAGAAFDVRIAGVHVNNSHRGGDVDFAKDWVCPNGVWTGHADHVLSRWGRTWWVPEAAQ